MGCYEFSKLSRKEQESLWIDPNWVAQEKFNGVRLILHFVSRCWGVLPTPGNERERPTVVWNSPTTCFYETSSPPYG